MWEDNESKVIFPAGARPIIINNNRVVALGGSAGLRSAFL